MLFWSIWASLQSQCLKEQLLNGAEVLLLDWIDLIDL